MSAYNLAKWFVANGHEVGVLTTSPKPENNLTDTVVDGMRIWRFYMPRGYSVFDAAFRRGWRKPVWHLQDHFDPRNVKIANTVLTAFKPDFVSIHTIQGLGYNLLRAIGARRIPTAFFLHDLGLACVKMAMFIDGKECAGLCRTCAISAKVKMSLIRAVPQIGFVSPSRANLERVSELQPIGAYPRAHILNANRYPRPTVEYSPAEIPRLVYVGRLQEAKGVHVVLDALEPLALSHKFHLKIVGTGPDEGALRERCANRDWVSFTGHVSSQEVTDIMAQSDLLLVPSIWLENSPGVVIQALGVSLPVMGSNKGGIPELVHDGVNGTLVEPGNIEAWRQALRTILENPAQLDEFRRNASMHNSEFDPDYLGRRTVEFFNEIRAFSGAQDPQA